MTTMNRRARGDRRRPAIPPSWPPTTEPPAIRPTTSQETWLRTMKSSAATPFVMRASRFFTPFRRCRSSSMKIATVRSGSRPVPPRSSRRRSRWQRPPRAGAEPWACAARPVAGPLAEPLGWSAMRRLATTMSTGTARRTVPGSASSREAPHRPPSRAADPGRTARRPWPRSSWRRPCTAERAGDQSNCVADVGEDRRVADSEQGRERDQRAGADNDVHGAGGEPRCRDGDRGRRRHEARLLPDAWATDRRDVGRDDSCRVIPRRC